ncbi:MAG: zinc-binding dehydrogenase [Oscillospiraceae bacterium]
MKKLIITGPSKAEIKEVTKPHAIDEWALIRVVYAGMCTENKRFIDGTPDEYVGHEAVGVVEEVVQGLHVKAGDRVVVPALYSCGHCELCDSGYYLHCENTPDGISAQDVNAVTHQTEGAAYYAQYLLKPERLLWIIPDDISFKHAAMANCGLGPSFGALHNMKVIPGRSVLITGMGGVGLGGVINAKHRGLMVIAVDTIPYRMNLAKSLGADYVFDARDIDIREKIRSVTKNLGPEYAIECSGTIPAQKLCMHAVKRLGHVCFVGGSYSDTPIKVTPELVVQGITITGSWMFPTTLVGDMMEVIRKNRTKLDLMITNIVPMSRAQQALEISSGADHGKMLLDPWS